MSNFIQTLTLATALLVMLPAIGFATAQQPDVLNYKGNEYKLFTNPLESFYKRVEDRPKFLVAPNTISTGNWRGYIATWKIEDGVLYLVKIDTWLCPNMDEASCRRVDLKTLFGTRYRDGQVKADWYSGALKIPDGKMLQYVHMGYGSVYEREIILQVKAGKVISDSTIDNTKRPIAPPGELELRELEKLKPKPDLR